MSKRKILFLITKSNWGGAQKYVFDLATGLPKEEFEVMVALGGEGALAHKLKEADIEVTSLPSLQRDISLAKELRSCYELWQVLRIERPDVLHINSSKAGALGALIGRLSGVRNIIFTAHGWAFNEDRPYWQKVVLKAIHWLTVLLAHQTVAVSNQVREQMDWPLAQKKMVTIYNGRDLPGLQDRDEARSHLSEIVPGLRDFRSDFWSMTIAELHPVKRHEVVVEAIKKLTDQGENIRHLIVGGGEEKTKLREKIVSLELEERVFLIGTVDEAARYLKAADLFILASRSEGMPYVIIEALIAGLPIVAARVGGIPEVIDDRISGLLTPPLDNKALFEAILEVYKDSSLRENLSKEAIYRSREFSLEKTIRRTISLYYHAN